MDICLIGFGEAARAFVGGGLLATAAYDVDPARREAIAGHGNLAAAIAGRPMILSLVTAGEALRAAEAAAELIEPGVIYFDMNSVAPETKRFAAAPIEDAGGHYLDVAVMAPVHPLQMAVPLIVSGPQATTGAQALRDAGFSDVRVVGDDVGHASAIKMIRSVMVKGVEALTAEMMLAARAAGVEAEVLASLGDDWVTKAAYNFERMTTHGARRASEMEESANTLLALGVDPVMTRGTIVWQRAMAERPLTPLAVGESPSPAGRKRRSDAA